MTRAVEVRITGHVQGVSFRAHTAREAVRLELVGWVSNEPDGSVAAHFEGPDDTVARMLKWCHVGSPGAQVAGVDVTEVAASKAASFEVGY